MKKLMTTVVALIATCASQAGTYSLASSETWNDAEIATKSAAFDGVEIAGGATLTLANASAVTLTMVITGGGNLVKDGNGVLTLGGVNTYSGELSVNAGVLKTLATAARASTHLGNPSKVTIADGATLDISEASSWDSYEILTASQPLYLSGAGFSGQGGAVRRATGAGGSKFGAIHLNADATFYHGVMYGANLFLHGYTYTIDGTGNEFRLLGQTVTPDAGGSIIAKCDLLLQNNWSTDVDLGGDAGNWLRLRGGNLTLSKITPISWTLSVESSAKIASGKLNVAAAKPNTWAGPVVISNGVTMTLAPVTDAQMTFDGTVVGSDGGNVTLDGPGTVVMSKGLSIRQHVAWDNANGQLKLTKDSGLLRIDGGCDLQGLTAEGGRLEIVNGNVSGLGGGGLGSFYQRTVGLTAGTSYAYLSNMTFQTGAASRYWQIGDMSERSGILELDNGTVFNLRGLVIGADTAASSTAKGWGAVYHRAGVSVTTQNDAKSGAFNLAAGEGSYGYYGMDGGSLTTSCTGLFANRGFAFFRQSGGTLKHNADIYVATNGGEAVIWQTGGTSESRYAFSPSTPDGAKVTLAVEGEGTSYTFKGGMWNQRLGFSCLNDVTLTLAANDGGELKTVRLDRSGDADSRAKFYLCFNGGRLHPTLGDEICNGVNPHAALVHEGGLVYDTTDVGDGKRSLVEFALAAPTGRVVSAIALPTDADFLAEPYIGSPRVTITGSGVGAAAVALFDERTRQVTGIRILSPGTGYDESTSAMIDSADRKKTYACAVTTLEAPTTGVGLRKVGANGLELRGSNSWHGPAVVEAGTLTFTGASSIPTGMAAEVWQGATLNLGSFAREISDLSGCGAVACSTALAVTNALILAATNSILTVTTPSFTLADGVTISVPNFDAVKDGTVERFELLSAPNGITYAGVVLLPEVGDAWKFRCRNKVIELVRTRGLAIIIR